jgi:hypothetical protein
MMATRNNSLVSSSYGQWNNFVDVDGIVDEG